MTWLFVPQWWLIYLILWFFFHLIYPFYFFSNKYEACELENKLTERCSSTNWGRRQILGASVFLNLVFTGDPPYMARITQSHSIAVYSAPWSFCYYAQLFRQSYLAREVCETNFMYLLVNLFLLAERGYLEHGALVRSNKNRLNILRLITFLLSSVDPTLNFR